MKKLVRKQVGIKKEKKIIKHEERIDDLGNLVEAYEEVIEVDVPVFGNVYEEMTKEEIKELEKLKNIEIPKPLEERLDDLEKVIDVFKGTFEKFLKKDKE